MEEEKKPYNRNKYRYSTTEINDIIINKFDFAKNDSSELIEKDDIMVSKEILDNERLSFDLIQDINKNEIKKNLLKGIYSNGFENPSRIQSLAIQQIINGKEILAQSQSGTGKTGAFVIGTLQSIDENLNKLQCIVLSPTQELAYQTLLVYTSVSQYMDVKFSYAVGGTDRQQNLKELNNGTETAQIMIATPGRLLDLLIRRPKYFEDVKILIIDECDELLKGKFKEDLRKIIGEKLPDTVQICLFSATLNKDIVNLSEKILKNPLKILIKKENMTLDGITQTYIKAYNQHEKIQILIDMLKTLPVEQFIVYVNSIENSDNLKLELHKHGLIVGTINSTNTKIERLEILRSFKRGEIKCLISTDLLSRGIDIQQLSLVINFDLPHKNNLECFVHRIGRSGRWGKKGLSINLVTEKEFETQTLISMTFKCQIVPLNENHLRLI
jgi:translation initiation factor 4A